jgi:NhaA family Na+:H+ antiporter
MNEPDINDRERELAPLERPVEKVLTPFDLFRNSQSITGVLLLIAAVAALALANSRYQHFYASLNSLPLSISLGDWEIRHSLQHWVNDGLMVLFFYILGLEIKRECLVGDLRDIRHSSLVLLMALGGMLVPAAVYSGVAMAGEPEMARGWGIPMATDTAFAIGILTLLGRRVPASALVTISALAIVDDIGAVLVISLFYSNDIHTHYLLAAGGMFLLMLLFNLAGIRSPLPYLAAGILLWWFTQHSGVHATTAGILAALTIPARPYAGTRWFSRRMKHVVERFEDLDEPHKSILEEGRQHQLAEQAREIAEKSTTPLQRWSSALDRPVSLSILPLFAFLNAGIEWPEQSLTLSGSLVMFATMAGLVLGKALGISAFAWVGVRLGLASPPRGLNFRHIIGLGFMAGIGFTMSFFIAALAFEQTPQLLVQAKLGVLIGSLLAGILGVIWMLLASRSADNGSR